MWVLEYEEKYIKMGKRLIVGVDEAGRGPLAGRVCAAAVVMPLDALIVGVDDSKKLSEKKRERLFDGIVGTAVSYGIGWAGVAEVESLNIENAARLAMLRAVNALSVTPDVVLIDGIRPPDTGFIQENIIKGDSLSYSIAAASILAKVSRDREMSEFDKIYPEYGFAKHKGYGTAEHIAAIGRVGLCPIHRRSFIKAGWLNG